MRRMNYNPFENPFASGEYDATNTQFILDKTLENNHLYFARIICSSNPYQTCFFLDTRENITDNCYTTPFVFVSNDGNFKVYSAWLDNNKVVIDVAGAPGVSNQESYIIHIYRLI